MTNSPYTSSTFGDWYVANYQEMSSLMNMGSDYGLNDAPFNLPNSSTYHAFSSTTQNASTGNVYWKQATLSYISTRANYSGSFRAMLVRTFTISGTTLS